MKWIYLLILVLMASLVHSQPIDLNSPETLQPLTSQQAVWDEISIFPTQKKMIVRYRWLTPSGDTISLFGREEQEWVCRDIVIEGTNPECITAGNPYSCCTGVGTGTCDDDDLCFSDIFTFPIPGGAVGLPFGAGFRTLLKNEWRDRRLSPGNDGTFE